MLILHTAFLFLPLSWLPYSRQRVRTFVIDPSLIEADRTILVRLPGFSPLPFAGAVTVNVESGAGVGAGVGSGTGVGSGSGVGSGAR